MGLNGERLIAGSGTGFASSDAACRCHFGDRSSSNFNRRVEDVFCRQARTTSELNGIDP